MASVGHRGGSPGQTFRMHCDDKAPCSFHNVKCEYPNCACGWGDKRRAREEKNRLIDRVQESE